MSNTIPQYTLTGDTVVVIVDGKTHTAKAGTVQFNNLRKALFEENWAEVHKHLTPALSLQQWAGDKFVVQSDQIAYQGYALPQALQQQIRRTANEGKSPAPLFAFYERLAKNPSKRSVDALFTFLSHANVAIEEDGTFLAYKGVTDQLLDCHTHSFDNSPGVTNSMPRNRVDDEPKHDCSTGFHVGSFRYASTFGKELMIVRVDPEYVVSVPYDESCQKMRVCQYTVVGHYGGQPLSSTTMTKADVEIDDDIDDGMDKRSGGKHKKVVLDSRKLKRIGKLGPKELIDESLDTLRAYAGKLKIVGASKMPGGKSALVARILRAKKAKR